MKFLVLKDGIVVKWYVFIMKLEDIVKDIEFYLV